MQIRVISMNMWNGGKGVSNGLSKIMKVLVDNNVDIAILQEVGGVINRSNLEQFLPNYHLCRAYYNKDLVIVSRFPLCRSHRHIPIRDPWFQLGCTAELPDGKRIHIWNVHLNPYPYVVDRIANEGLRDSHEIYRLELNSRWYWHCTGRLNEIRRILEDYSPAASKLKKLNSTNDAFILAGDFNTPSHLDWIESTAECHSNFTCNWPVTKWIHEKTPLIDSYRQIHPDPLEHPGITYTFKCDQANNSRLDYIFYAGNNIIVQDSNVYFGNSDGRGDDWPSDHAAVITDFVIT